MVMEKSFIYNEVFIRFWAINTDCIECKGDKFELRPYIMRCLNDKIIR